MRAKFPDFLSDEQGTTAIEYGLIAALICLAMLGGLTTMGTSLVAFFDDTGKYLSEIAVSK